MVKVPNSFTLILHVKALMAQRKRPPLQPALTELMKKTKRESVRYCAPQKRADGREWKKNTVPYLPREYRPMKRTADMNSFVWY